MNIKKFMVSALVLLGSVPLLASDPFIDPNGLVHTPTGYITNPGYMALSVNNSSLFHYTDANPFIDSSTWSQKYKTNQSNISAFYTPFENISVGLTSLVDVNRNTELGVNLHYQLMDESAMLPAVSFGGNMVGVSDQQGYYVVASRHVFPNLSATVGLGGGIYQNSGSNNIKGLLLGANLDLGALSLMTDLDGQGIQLGAKYHFTDTFAMNFGVSEFENWATRHWGDQITRAANDSLPRITLGFTLQESFVNKPVARIIGYDEAQAAAAKTADNEKSLNQKLDRLFTQVGSTGNMDTRTINEKLDTISEQINRRGQLGVLASSDTLPKVDSDKAISAKYPNINISIKSNAKNQITALMLGNRELCKFFPETKQPVSTYAMSPYERAMIVKNRILTLIESRTFKPVAVSALNDTIAGISGDTLLFSVTKEDAAGHSMSASSLANEWSFRINDYLNEYLAK